MSDIERRVGELRRRIAAAAERAGRDPAAITLLGVSKTVEPATISEAVAAGVTDLGENRVQEAEWKAPQVVGSPRWHLVGNLQSNKSRLAAALFDVVHSVDRLSLVGRLGPAAAERDKILPVYVQVEYVRTEDTEDRVEDRAQEICAAVLRSPALRLMGLMTLPPFDSDPENARPWFRRLRRLRDRCEGDLGAELPGLSMGMTNDFEVAVEEGATIVRVGTAIFGSRTAP